METFVRRYRRREEARARYGPLADTYARFYRAVDPVGDAAAAALAERPDAAGELEAGLRGGPTGGPAIRALLEEAWRVPPWVDFEAMRAGAHLQQRLGRLGLMILGAWGLVNGYHSAAAVKPLVFTGQLERMALRRLTETSRYVTTATDDDALRPGRPGWVMSVRVRLMHAMVRRMIRLRGRWHDDAWGAPINQADMAGTLIEFSAFIIMGARALGFSVSEAEAESLTHLWRYAGHLNGVHPDLLAEFRSGARLERLATLVHLVQPGPDADSKALTHALRASIIEAASTPAERRLAPLLQRLHDGLSWTLNVDTIAADLEIPNAGWRHAVRALRGPIRVAEIVRRAVPGVDGWVTRIGRAGVESDLAARPGARPDFQARRIPRPGP